MVLRFGGALHGMRAWIKAWHVCYGRWNVICRLLQERACNMCGNDAHEFHASRLLTRKYRVAVHKVPSSHQLYQLHFAHASA